jgi:hypothetical protein
VRSVSRMICSVLRSYERELVCSRCRNVIAWIRLGPVALIKIRHVSGYAVTPLGGAVAMRILKTRLASAQRALDAAPNGDPDLQLAVIVNRERIDYLRRDAGELVYELDCACGASWLRSLPHLAHEVRAGATGRIPLG